MTRKKTAILVAILAYCIIVIIGLSTNIIPYFKGLQQRKTEEANAKELVEKIEEKEQETVPIVATPSVLPEEKKFEITSKYNDILKKYPDVVGKVKIDDTNIDYLVVQTNDNEFYLDKDYDKNTSKSGAIFMDKDSETKKLSDKLEGNIVLYGHNMKAGTMFHNLRYYVKEDFAKEHNIIQFDTLAEDLKFEVFSVYAEDASNGCIGNDTQYPDGFDSYLDELVKKSKIDMECELSDVSCILTLITCDYSYDNGRLFVHAKLVE